MIEAGDVNGFREAVISKAKSIDIEDHAEYAYELGMMVDALKDSIILDEAVAIPDNLTKSYKTRSELHYWLQNQINQILACGICRRGNNRLVDQVYRYTVSNISNAEINLNRISSHLSVTNSHLSRLLKKYVGRNYVDIVSDLRLAIMIELLNTTDMKDRDIGEKIGIYDPHYVSIWFKKVTGLSPSEYRKSNI